MGSRSAHQRPLGQLLRAITSPGTPSNGSQASARVCWPIPTHAPRGGAAEGAATGPDFRPPPRRGTTSANKTGPATRTTPSTPARKPPTLSCHAWTMPDSGSGLGGKGAAPFADVGRERRIRGLAREHLQLSLQLLELALNRVELRLHRQHVAHRRRLGHDRQVLLPAGLERGDTGLQVHVLPGDVGRLRRQTGGPADPLCLLERGGEVVHRHLEGHRAEGRAAKAGTRLRLGVGDEAAVGAGEPR